MDDLTIRLTGIGFLIAAVSAMAQLADKSAWYYPLLWLASWAGAALGVTMAIVPSAPLFYIAGALALLVTVALFVLAPRPLGFKRGLPGYSHGTDNRKRKHPRPPRP